METISLIIPVYNGEKCIDSCLTSIEQQERNGFDIEIIVVDDGSTDNTGEIVKNHSNVKYFYQENQGQGSARNYGFEKSTGSWIAFCDADDYLDPCFLSKLYGKAFKEIDIVVCNIRRIVNGKTIEDKLKVFGSITPKEALISLNPGPTNKLYRRNVLENNKFLNNGKRYEDLAVFPGIICSARNIYVIKDCLYNYVINENSTMRKWDEGVDDIFYVLDYIKQQKYYNNFCDELDYLRFKHCLFGHTSRIIYFDNARIKKELDLINTYINNNFKDYWSNELIRSEKNTWFYVGLRIYRLHLFPLLIIPLRIFEKYIKR